MKTLFHRFLISYIWPVGTFGVRLWFCLLYCDVVISERWQRMANYTLNSLWPVVTFGARLWFCLLYAYLKKIVRGG